MIRRAAPICADLRARQQYVMRLFRNGSLRCAIQRGHAFDSIQGLSRFSATIASAIAHAHDLNFVHRDLKPENILLDDDEEPCVADWGLGQFIHQHSQVLDLTRAGPMGSAYYCSWEQWTTGRCDHTGDVYSLGVILAELAAGQAVPIAPLGAGIRWDAVIGSSWAARELNNLIREMTAVVPTQRVGSMRDVERALRCIGS